MEYSALKLTQALLESLDDLDLLGDDPKSPTSEHNRSELVLSVKKTPDHGSLIVRLPNDLLYDPSNLIKREETPQYLARRLRVPVVILHESSGYIAFRVCLERGDVSVQLAPNETRFIPETQNLLHLNLQADYAALVPH